MRKHIKHTALIILSLSFLKLSAQEIIKKDKSDSFTCILSPNAEFPGGKTAIMKYLKTNVVDKATITIEQAIVLQKIIASAKIDTSGNVTKIRIIKSSNVTKIDSLMMDALHKMPKWNPARINNQAIEQDYIFPLIIELK